MRFVLKVLEGGQSLFTGALVRGVCNDVGISADIPVEVRFARLPTASEDKDDDPALLSMRWRWAALEAVAELAAQGHILPGEGSPQQQEHRNYPPVPTSIGIRHPGGGEGVPVAAWPPVVGIAYRLSLGARQHRWYLEPTLFVEGLETLELDQRARRALDEALRAYRRGLYLACTSLLGVVLEAAWYSAATALVPSGQLLQAVEQERTARMQQLLSERLKVGGVAPTLPFELLAFAALLRELRNYGVHPAGEINDDLERYFTEEAAGLLILQTHHHLTKLSGAVETVRGNVTAPS